MKRAIAIAALAALAIYLILTGVVCQRKRSASKLPKAAVEAGSLYKEALSLQSKLKRDEAIKLYQELIKQFPQQEEAADAWYKLGGIYESQALWEEAQEAFAKIVTEFPSFEQISDVEERLWNANMKILFSPLVTDKDIRYKVEAGDTLGKIAAEHNTTVALIKRSNNLESDLIRPEQRLKISTAEYSVIVDKSQNSLTLKADDKILKVYPVATGAYNSTPVGTFIIAEKLINPDWFKSGVGPIPAASPENILGTRWMSLSESDYGIHGGASDEDLRTQVTNGCIRMKNADVEELFTILPRGTEVTIVE